jgi:hypothetical protein
MTSEGAVGAGLMDRVVRAVKLDPTVYKEVAMDDSKTVEAMIVVGIAAAIGGLGLAIGPGDFRFGSWIGAIILTPTLGLAIGTGILWLIGKLFNGKAQFIEMFRPLGYAYAPTALGIIPFIGGFIGGIWTLVCAVIAVRESEDVSTGSAAAIVLIPAAIFLVLGLIIAAAFIGALIGFANS